MVRILGKSTFSYIRRVWKYLVPRIISAVKVLTYNDTEGSYASSQQGIPTGSIFLLVFPVHLLQLLSYIPFSTRLFIFATKLHKEVIYCNEFSPSTTLGDVGS